MMRWLLRGGGEGEGEGGGGEDARRGAAVGVVRHLAPAGGAAQHARLGIRVEPRRCLPAAGRGWETLGG